MAIYDDVKITINLNELVETRAKLITQYADYSKHIVKGEFLDGSDIDRIAIGLRDTLTWQHLHSMVDDAVLDYLDIKDIKETHYGEIQPEPGREAELNRREAEAKKRKQYFEKNFDLVKLESSSWTLEVPIRKN